MNVQSIPNLVGMKELLDSFNELLNKIKETAFKKVNVLDKKNKGLKKEYDKFEGKFTQEEIEFNKEANKNYIKMGAKNILKSTAKVIGITTLFLLLLTSSERAKYEEANSVTLNGISIVENYQQEDKQYDNLEDKIIEYLDQNGVGVNPEERKLVDSKNIQVNYTETTSSFESLREGVDFEGSMNDTLESLGAVNQIIKCYSHNNVIYENNAEIARWLKKMMKCIEVRKNYKKDIMSSEEKKFSSNGEVDDLEDMKDLDLKSKYGEYYKIPNKLGRPSKKDLFLKMVDEMVKGNENKREISENTNFER